MSEAEKKSQILLRQYDRAVARATFESEQQVARNNFFMIFQGVAIAGLLGAIKDVKRIQDFYCMSGLFPLFAFFFFLLAICQAKNAAGAVRIMFGTGDRAAELEKEYLINVGCSDYYVYQGDDYNKRMKNIREKAKKKAAEDGRCIGGLFEEYTLWRVDRNKYIARNNLYAAWVFCVLWFSVICAYFYQPLQGVFF